MNFILTVDGFLTSYTQDADACVLNQGDRVNPPRPPNQRLCRGFDPLIIFTSFGSFFGELIDTENLCTHALITITM